MKIISVFLSVLLLTYCASGKEKTYTASTPADPAVRLFLGIPLSDSVDFIRWKIIFSENRYKLRCNYGIGKANTNGFINGGKQIELEGELRKEKYIFQLQNGNKTLKAAELNTDLLHLMDDNNQLLIGNGGWSYTVNNITPSVTDEINLTAKQTFLQDSMAFEGRTPCNVPGVIAPGTLCYKLKWYIVLYTNAEKKGPGTYRIFGTPWREEGGRKGNWKIIAGKNGRTIYQVNDEKGTGFLYLLKLDEHILVFADADGKLLVGDHDFSYTLNKKF